VLHFGCKLFVEAAARYYTYGELTSTAAQCISVLSNFAQKRKIIFARDSIYAIARIC